MSRANTTELVGAVAHVHETAGNLALPDKIWRFQWHDTASSPVFYHALFRTPSVKRQISRLSSGTGGSMKNVSKTKLRSMDIPCVPIPEQLAFAERAGRLVDIRAEVANASAFDHELFASLRSRAFKREL